MPVKLLFLLLVPLLLGQQECQQPAPVRIQNMWIGPGSLCETAAGEFYVGDFVHDTPELGIITVPGGAKLGCHWLTEPHGSVWICCPSEDVCSEPATVWDFADGPWPCEE